MEKRRLQFLSTVNDLPFVECVAQLYQLDAP